MLATNRMTRAEKFTQIKSALVALGYRYEASRDGTERLYRPDGTLAVLRQPGRDPDAEVDRV